MELNKYYTSYKGYELVNTKSTGSKKNIKELIDSLKSTYGKGLSDELRKNLKHTLRG